MAKKIKETIKHNIEIASDENTTINGDVVGQDKVTTNVNVNVVLEERIKKSPAPKNLHLQKVKTNNSQKDVDKFSPKEIKKYLLAFSGMTLILIGILITFGIITLNTISKAGLSGAAGVNAGETPESSESIKMQSSSLPETVLTLTSSLCDANIEILSDSGDVILTILIAPNKTQTFKLPAGNYTYNVKYHCPSNLGGVAGMSNPTDYSKNFYLPTDGNVQIGTPKKSQSVPSFGECINPCIGIILIFFGFRFFQKNKSQDEY